jgi:hypothetical protein
MRTYKVTYNHNGETKEFTVHCKSAQEAANYFYGWSGEHDVIYSIERISSNGNLITCKWQ